MTQHELVLEFHRRFGVPIADAPRPLGHDEFSFRAHFLNEELVELIEAYRAGDFVKQVDALLDLAYVVHGTAAMMGLPWERLFDAVHAANMRKISAREAHARGIDVGSVRHEYDVRKPPGWVGPEDELSNILLEHGYEGQP